MALLSPGGPLSRLYTMAPAKVKAKLEQVRARAADADLVIATALPARSLPVSVTATMRGSAMRRDESWAV